MGQLKHRYEDAPAHTRGTKHIREEKHTQQTTCEDALKEMAVRSYRQIAELLARPGGDVMTPAHVAHLCRQAEMKFVRRLMADPLIRARFQDTGRLIRSQP